MNKTQNIKVALTVSAALAASSVFADEMKIATAAPAGTPWVTHLEASNEALSAATGGDMTIAVFAGSQLGPETEVIKQVARGRVDGGVFSTSASATVVPEVGLITSPFFWDSFEQAECAIDNHLTDVFAPMFEERGLRIVQWQELGWLNVFSHHEVSSPADVQGVKFRIAPIDANDILGRAIGVSGVPMAFSDIAAALETGLIDAGELPTISYVASGLGKIAPHLTNTRHNYQPSIMLMSTRTWNGLSEEEQASFNDNMQPAQDLRESVRGAIEFFEGKLVESGGTVNDLSDEERQEWSSLFTEEMQQQIIDGIGGRAEEVYAAMVEARAACTN